MEDILNLNKQNAINSLNKLFKDTSSYFNMEYKILIYRLLTNGHVKLGDLEKASGLTSTRLYQIIDEVKSYINQNEKIPSGDANIS